MAGVTQQEKRRRLAIVEEAIDKFGWSLRVERSLAERLGVTARAIRRYKLEVIERHREDIEPVLGNRTEARVDLLGSLRSMRRAAQSKGKFGPAVSMVSLEMRLLGVWEAPEELAPPDSLESVERGELIDELASELTLEEATEVLERLQNQAAGGDHAGGS
jgi:hypothetical protein